MAALLPFGNVAYFLNEALPDTATTNTVTVRNRTRRVGGRLLRDQAKPAGSARPTPSQTGLPSVTQSIGDGFGDDFRFPV